MSMKSKKTTSRRAPKKKTAKKTAKPVPRWAREDASVRMLEGIAAMGNLQIALTIGQIASVLIEDTARASLGPDATEKEVCELSAMLIARASAKVIRGCEATDGVRMALVRGMELALGEPQ